MFKILDLLYIRTVERNCGFTFTREQLAEAKFNEGHVSVRIEGRYRHFKIPIITLSELINVSKPEMLEESTPWD